jgi:selenide,water dikinase
MMRNSGTTAMLDLDRIPFLEPAIDYAKQGIKSSLWSSNRSAISNWSHDDTGKSALLFDPQTAGGLLAAIPEDAAPDIIDDLRKAGEAAHIIGHVTKTDSPGIDLI